MKKASPLAATIKIAKAAFVPALIVYALWAWASICEVQGLVDLQYDTSQCAAAGMARSQTRKCFADLGYTVRQGGPNSVRVYPSSYWFLPAPRQFLQLDYNRSGVVRTSRLAERDTP